MTRKACDGGETVPVRVSMEHMDLCRACGMSIRFDLANHPFWGFQNCGKRTRKVDAVVPGGSSASQVDHARKESDSKDVA